MWIVVGMIESVVGEFFCGWRAMKASQNLTNSQPIPTNSHNSKNKKCSPFISPKPTLTKFPFIYSIYQLNKNNPKNLTLSSEINHYLHVSINHVQNKQKCALTHVEDVPQNLEI